VHGRRRRRRRAGRRDIGRQDPGQSGSASLASLIRAAGQDHPNI
jgi:hypothetical protein